MTSISSPPSGGGGGGGISDVTAGSFVQAWADSGLSLSAADWDTLPTDTTTIDANDEFDTANYQFTPGSTMYYHIIGQVIFSAGSDGDSLNARFRDVDNANDIIRSNETLGDNSSNSVHIMAVKELSAGTTYEFQVRNYNSSDWIEAYEQKNYLALRGINR